MVVFDIQGGQAPIAVQFFRSSDQDQGAQVAASDGEKSDVRSGWAGTGKKVSPG